MPSLHPDFRAGSSGLAVPIDTPVAEQLLRLFIVILPIQSFPSTGTKLFLSHPPASNTTDTSGFAPHSISRAKAQRTAMACQYAAIGDQILKFSDLSDNFPSPLFFALFGSHSDLAIVCRRLQSNITKLRLQRQ
jgi:hypothetical protein